MSSHKRLYIPGPVEVGEDILLQQAKHLVGHRSNEFTQLYTSVIGKLVKFFETKQHVLVMTASGTIFMDMSGRNLVKNKVLACECGAFSERMGKALAGCGKEVDHFKIDWGKAFKPEMIAEKLSSNEYDAVTVVHNETSTGVRNPIYKIGEMLKKGFPDVSYIIDSVSAMAGDLTLPDKIKSDLIFASVQKCFGLPPGLAVGVLSEKALEKAKTIPNRGFYTDLVGILDYYAKKQQTPSTPNISLLYALDYQLSNFLEETAQKIHDRHLEMAKYTREWAKKKGFELFAEPGYESVTVTTVKNTLGKNVGELNKELAKRNMQLANGYGKLKDQTFRIGHMGNLHLGDIKELLWHIDEIWGL
ncbi:MAG: pyridoxal-phosphate-dependent aminotransferase family protein [Candidatus Hodarchaeota archaeon]